MSAARTGAWLLLGASAVGAALVACGPSYQAVYESDARFEHCYALDDTPTATLQKKGDCWREWFQRYTYGQTRNRVEYAVARYRALSRVPDAPTDEAMMQAAPGEGAAPTTLAGPAPTSAFAPPPNTLLQTDGGAPRSSALPSSPPATSDGLPVVPDGGTGASAVPGTECSERCTDGWKVCTAKSGVRSSEVCNRTHLKCMRGCFR